MSYYKDEVDLDNALLALDAAGLDSEFDFNYECHLSHLGGSLVFGEFDKGNR